MEFFEALGVGSVGVGSVGRVPGTELIMLQGFNGYTSDYSRKCLLLLFLPHYQLKYGLEFPQDISQTISVKGTIGL